MNKQDFLKELENALSGLPEEEIKKTTDYYCEMIDDAVENGENEYGFIEKLGSVEEISQKIIGETHGYKIKKKTDVSQIILILLSSPIWLPLLVAAFAIIFALYVVMWSIVVTLFSVCTSFAVAAVVLITASVFLAVQMPVRALLFAGFALLLAGLSIWIFYFARLCAKLVIRLSVLVFKKVKEIFIKKGADNNEEIN